ncbi:PTS mannose/fructose/sorbose/N-acetylgalactosamine transporter subunit IIC [Lacticaseibacillus suihuaensis]
MLPTATLAALCVFVCFGGNWLWGQTMIERPLVVGLIAGLMFGDVRTGILMGAALEAIFMGAVDIGGALSAEPVTATVLATTFAITLDVNTKAALALAVPIGVFAAFISMFLKNVVMNVFAPAVDRVAANNDPKALTWLHFGMWFLNYFVFSLVTFFSVLAGAKPVQHLVTAIPQNLMAGLSATGGLLPAVGFAILMRMLWSRQLSPYYFLGFVLSAYMALPSVAVAAMGIIIVCLQWLLDKQLLTLSQSRGAAPAAGDEQAKEEEAFFE